MWPFKKKSPPAPPPPRVCSHEYVALAAVPGMKECYKCEDMQPISPNDRVGKYGIVDANVPSV